RSTKGVVASQISVAKTRWLALFPMRLPLASSKPRPLTLMRPSVSTSALRSPILHGPPPGKTPLTTFSFAFGNVPSGFAGPAPFESIVERDADSGRGRSTAGVTWRRAWALQWTRPVKVFRNREGRRHGSALAAGAGERLFGRTSYRNARPDSVGPVAIV